MYDEIALRRINKEEEKEGERKKVGDQMSLKVLERMRMKYL